MRPVHVLWHQIYILYKVKMYEICFKKEEIIMDGVTKNTDHFFTGSSNCLILNAQVHRVHLTGYFFNFINNLNIRKRKLKNLFAYPEKKKKELS